MSKLTAGRLALSALLCTAAAALLTAQLRAQAQSRPTTFGAAHRELLAALRASTDEVVATADPRATPRTPRDRLEAFISRWESTHATEPRLLAARCQLATMLLTAFDAPGAVREFDRVLERAAASERELRGRALYGLAQARELQGDLDGARRALRRTLEEARDLRRYGRFAEIALRRLDRGPLRVGAPAPPLGPRRDVSDKPRQLSDFVGRHALIAFAALSDETARIELRALFKAATAAGMNPETQILILATDGDENDATGVLASERWSIPVVLCSREFLDTDALAYGVRQLPATFLIGPDGSLLARGPTPRSLRTALSH